MKKKILYGPGGGSGISRTQSRISIGWRWLKVFNKSSYVEWKSAP